MTISDSDTNRKGDFAEYYVVTWLWDQGYEVFKNCACTGPVDMIAMNSEGDCFLIDVKTLTYDPRHETLSKTKRLTDKQKELGVQVVAFHPETRKVHFVGHRHETAYNRHRDEHNPQQDLVLCDSGC